MSDVSALAIAIGGVAGVVISSVYYPVVSAQWADASVAGASAERPPPWKLVLELLRGALLTAVFAALAAEIGADTAADGLLLGLCLWIGFPLILWTGAILWENTPWKLAAVHGGDWLVKLLAVGAIVGALQ